MRFIRTDASLSLLEPSDNHDAQSVWMRPDHKQAKQAVRDLGGAADSDGAPLASSKQLATITAHLHSLLVSTHVCCANTQALINGSVAAEPAANASADGAAGGPVTIDSGYPSLGASLEVWGPTSDAAQLRAFFEQHGAARSWGCDYKSNSLEVGAQEPRSSDVTVISLATCRACLVWDVSAGGVPPELRDWLEDGGAHKIRMRAQGSVNIIARSLGVTPRGFLDLQSLFSANRGHALEDRVKGGDEKRATGAECKWGAFCHRNPILPNTP